MVLGELLPVVVVLSMLRRTEVLLTTLSPSLYSPFSVMWMMMMVNVVCALSAQCVVHIVGVRFWAKK